MLRPESQVPSSDHDAPALDGADALVLGAGVVGMATAYALARRGLRVAVVDRAEGPGRGTSFANGAQLSYAYTDALASPKLVAKLPWLVLARDPAFRLRPSLDPDFLRWGLAFLANARTGRFEANTLEGLKLGLESRLAMHRLLAADPIAFAHAAPGKLHLFEDRAAFAAAVRLAELKSAAGAVQRALTPAEAAAVEPGIAAAVPRLAGAIHSPQEEVGDPWRFCTELRARLESHYAVRTRFGMDVARIDLSEARPALVTARGERIQAARLVICTGVDAPPLLRRLGIRVPIWPMKGYSFTAPAGGHAPAASITDVARKLVFCNLGGQIRVAGLAELGNRSLALDERRFAALLAASRTSLPEAADYDAIVSRWTGLRPMTPDSLPVIRSVAPGVVLNVGHGALGWTYAMGSGERSAEALLKGAD